MMKLLLLLKNYKSIGTIVGIIAALGSLYAVYDNVRDDWYEQGVQDTERTYQQKMLEAQQKYNTELEEKLSNYRKQMNANFAEELNRVKAERVVETKVKEVIEYVDREIEIPIQCNTVPSSFSGLFNQSISRINRSGNF